MPDHAVVEVRLSLALDPEDPMYVGGWKIEWRRPFEQQWHLIATEAFDWIHIHDLPMGVDAIICDAVSHVPQVLPFE